MRLVGQLATAAEIHSAQVYWHLGDDNIVYPAGLREKRMLGILWQNLAQYQTWFGGQAFMVHGASRRRGQTD
jgi:endoglucanase Acf2